MEYICSFVLPVIFGTISGLKNGVYYYIRHLAGILITVLMLTLVIGFNIIEYEFPESLLLLIPVGVLWVMYKFVLVPRNSELIHYFEKALQVSFFMVCVLLGVNVLLLICAAYTWNWLFNWIIRYMESKYYLHSDLWWNNVCALWNTSDEEMSRQDKGNFRLITLSGKAKTILGIIGLGLSILIYSLGWNLSLNLF